MAKDQPPAFLWYPRDFTASVAGMSDSHELAYRRALDQSWLEECYGVGQPSLWRRWSRATDEEWPALEAALLPHVEVQKDGTWAQVRMAKERMEQDLYSRGQSERGRKGGLSRSKRRRSAAKARLKQNVALPLPLQSAFASAEKKIQNQTLSSADADFDRFWTEYPKKRHKEEARAQWKKHRPPIEEVLRAIAEQKRWRLDAPSGEFRPEWLDPERWIKRGCWTDECPNGNGNAEAVFARFLAQGDDHAAR